jgi:hypothetical protein
VDVTYKRLALSWQALSVLLWGGWLSNIVARPIRKFFDLRGEIIHRLALANVQRAIETCGMAGKNRYRSTKMKLAQAERGSERSS